VKIYLVGGAIRNTFLKLPIIDRDWLIVGSTPDELLKKKYKQVGKDFPVFLHPITHEEYALARKEKKFGVGYKGFEFNYSSNITLKDDLVRRDLTINAIAQDCQGNYIDPFHGIKDIKLRILRHISDSFCEDPLRVLRVARFSALFFHLGFKIAKDTMLLMKKVVESKEILHLDVNRIWKETEKAIKSKNPHVFFQVLNCCNALEILFPEITKLILVHKNLYVFYTTKNIYEFCFRSLSKISQFSCQLDIKFAYLCQCLSASFVYLYVSQYELDFNKTSIVIMKKFFNRFNIPNIVSSLSILVMQNQHFLYNIHYQPSTLIIQLLYKINAWRKPEIVLKLAFLIDFYINTSGVFKSRNYLIQPGEYFKKVFYIANKVSTKSLLNKKLVGIAIGEELKKLRIFAIDSWRLSINK